MIKLPTLVSTISLGNGMGKTLAADYLVRQYDYIKLSFAGPMKNMLETLYCSMGFTSGEAADMIYGSGKERPVPGLAMDLQPTPRSMMISLGTGWGRDMVYHGLWCDVVKARIMTLLSEGARVVIDDARFANEGSMLATVDVRPALFILIQRPSVPIIAANQIGDLAVYRIAQVKVRNDRSPGEFYSELDAVMFNYEGCFGGPRPASESSTKSTGS